jgi:hypothetical protein
MTFAATDWLEASRTPVLGPRSMLWFIARAQLVAQIDDAPSGADSFLAIAWTVLELFAESAKTIRAIPPRSARQRRSASGPGSG